MGFDSHKYCNNINKYRYNLSKQKNFSLEEIKKFEMLEDFTPPMDN